MGKLVTILSLLCFMPTSVFGDGLITKMYSSFSATCTFSLGPGGIKVSTDGKSVTPFYVTTELYQHDGRSTLTSQKMGLTIENGQYHFVNTEIWNALFGPLTLQGYVFTPNQNYRFEVEINPLNKAFNGEIRVEFFIEQKGITTKYDPSGFVEKKELKTL